MQKILRFLKLNSESSWILSCLIIIASFGRYLANLNTVTKRDARFYLLDEHPKLANTVLNPLHNDPS